MTTSAASQQATVRQPESAASLQFKAQGHQATLPNRQAHETLTLPSTLILPSILLACRSHLRHHTLRLILQPLKVQRILQGCRAGGRERQPAISPHQMWQRMQQGGQGGVWDSRSHPVVA